MLPTIIVSKILFIANLPQHVIYAVAAPALLKLVSAFFLCTTVYAVIILCYNNRMLVLKFIKAALNQANGGERIKAKDFLSEETIFVIQAMFIGLFIIAVILFCLYIGVNYVA